jgi:hypothetical protein
MTLANKTGCAKTVDGANPATVPLAQGTYAGMTRCSSHSYTVLSNRDDFGVNVQSSHRPHREDAIWNGISTRAGTSLR